MVYLRYNLADGQSSTINIRLVAYLATSRDQSGYTVGLGQAGLEFSLSSASLVSDLTHSHNSLAHCPGLVKTETSPGFGAKLGTLRGVSATTLSAGDARGCGAHHTGNASH